MKEKPGSESKRQKFCTGCGESLQSEYEFCPYCGEKRAVAIGNIISSGKVTPISPEARKMLEEFDNQFEQLRQKRNRKFSGRGRNKESDLKTLVIIGSIAIFLLLLVCIYFSRQFAMLSSIGSGY